MLLVKHILQEKGHNVWSIPHLMSVEDALKLMAEKNVGAVLVVEGENVVGIFSERDLARKLSYSDICSLEVNVSEFMTSPVSVIQPDFSLSDCMNLMTNEHIRHLPVMEGDRLVGLVSIGDIVKGLIIEYEENIHNLEEYICTSPVLER